MKKLSLIFFLSLVFSLKAQHPYYYSLNDDSGLPSNEVYQVVQDSKGFIWIGCDAGLYRYNGFEFKSYKNVGQNSRSISNLSFDNRGNLWCRNFSGQIFKLHNDSLYLVMDFSTKAKKVQVAFTETGNIWKLEKNKLSKHNSIGLLLNEYQIPFNMDSINSGVEMKCFNNVLFLEFVGIGLYGFNESTKEMELLSKNNLYTNISRTLFFEFDNKLYLFRSAKEGAGENSIFEIDFLKKQAKEIHRYQSLVRTFLIVTDKDKKLWFATSNGAKQYDAIRQISDTGKYYFSENKISSVLHDEEGNYWFTDLQNGIHIIPNLYAVSYTSKNSSLFDTDISTLNKLSDTVLIIGTYTGNVFLFNTISNKFSLPDPIKNNKGITAKDIEVYKDKIYVSRGKLLVYNEHKNEIIVPEYFRNARDILIDNDTLYGVHPEFVSKIAINTIQHDKDLLHEIVLNTGGRKVVKEPKSNTLYFAFNDGLYAYTNGISSKIKYKNEDIYAYSSISDNEYVWLGTHNQGLLKIKSGEVVKQFILPEFYSDNGIKVLTSNGNFIWGSTNSNWFRFNKQTEEFQTYSNNIGVNPKDIYDIEKCGSNLFIGTRKSLMQIPLSLDPENKHIPAIYVNTIATDNAHYTIDSNLVLPYNFTNLKFEFISFSYSSKKDFYYRYRLIGLDSNWVISAYDNPHSIFSSLPPGAYTFQLQSINESGIASNIYSKSFVVLTPIWQKGWFYFAVSLCAISIVILIARYQINMIKKRNEAEKKMIQSQLTALKAQMNPHFMYNALNSIQALILKHDIKNSNLYLSKFSNLMRKVLDASGKDEISLKEETEILELYLSLEKLRFGNDFVYSINVSDEIDVYDVYVPPLLLQPFVENAIKHGLLHKKGEKLLKIDFYLKDKMVYCSIKDNGIGRKHAQQIKERMQEGHLSFSTQANEKRLELLNSHSLVGFDIEIIDLYDNDIATGTEVLIKIPLNKFGNNN